MFGGISHTLLYYVQNTKSKMELLVFVISVICTNMHENTMKCQHSNAVKYGNPLFILQIVEYYPEDA